LSVNDMNKMLSQITLQKAQAYLLKYVEHFCNVR